MARKSKDPPRRAAPRKPAEKRLVPRKAEKQLAVAEPEERVLRGEPVLRFGATADVDVATALVVGRAARLGGGQFEPKLPRAVIRCTLHGCGFVRASDLLRHLRAGHGVPLRRGTCADCGDLLFPAEILKRLPPPAVLSALRQHSRVHPLGGDFTGIEPVSGLH